MEPRAHDGFDDRAPTGTKGHNHWKTIIDRPLELAELHFIDIRVLPWEVEAHAAMAGSFAILDFDNPDDPAVSTPTPTPVPVRGGERPCGAVPGGIQRQEDATPRNGDSIQVRDSKDKTGPVLRFTRAEFAAFLDGALHGEFNDLLD